MSIATLTVIIASICIRPDYTRSEKEVCIEVITNCAIVEDGKVRSDIETCFGKPTPKK